jgi:hypothetical protein
VELFASSSVISFGRYIAMLNTEQFFQKQVEECREMAKRAGNKEDRTFWQHLAQGWEACLAQQQKPPSSPSDERTHTRHFFGRKTKHAA